MNAHVGRQGFTLTEIMVALAVGAAVLIIILFSFSSLSSSLAATGHYRDMHRDIRHAMDVLKRDLVRGVGVSQCVPSNTLELVITEFGSSATASVVYSLQSNILYRTENSDPAEELAERVHEVSFALYDMSGAATTSAADAYFVEVEIAMQTQGVRDTYADRLQARVRLRSKGL